MEDQGADRVGGVARVHDDLAAGEHRRVAGLLDAAHEDELIRVEADVLGELHDRQDLWVRGVGRDELGVLRTVPLAQALGCHLRGQAFSSQVAFGVVGRELGRDAGLPELGRDEEARGVIAHAPRGLEHVLPPLVAGLLLLGRGPERSFAHQRRPEGGLLLGHRLAVLEGYGCARGDPVGHLPQGAGLGAVLEIESLQCPLGRALVCPLEGSRGHLALARLLHDPERRRSHAPEDAARGGRLPEGEENLARTLHVLIFEDVLGHDDLEDRLPGFLQTLGRHALG